LPVVRWIGARPGRELHPAGVAAALAAIDAEDLQNVDYDAVRLILDRRPAPATVSTTIGGNPALIAAELLEAAGAEVVQQTVEDLAAQLEEPIEVPEWIAALSPAEAKAAADDLRQQLSNGWIENDGKLGDQLDYLEKRASEAQ
jgi:RecA-family ATPase